MTGRSHEGKERSLTERELRADARDQTSDERDQVVGRRDDTAGRRERVAERPDLLGGTRDAPAEDVDVPALLGEADRADAAAERRDRAADARDRNADVREQADGTSGGAAGVDRTSSAVDRWHSGSDRDLAAGQRADLLASRRHAVEWRDAAAENRQQSALDRVQSGAGRQDAGKDHPPDLPLAAELSVVFARMAGLLLSQETVQTSLELITALAHDTIPTSLGSAVSLIDERGRRTTAATTHHPLAAADTLQYELNEGPCLTAWAHRSVVRVDDTRTESRWPRWCGAVQELGVLSVLSAPLIAGDLALGAMKVYSRQASAFGADAERRLSMFAPQAAVLLANVQSHEAATELSEGLKQALRTRDVIATAKGIVMARDGLDEESALQMLVAASQREHSKLRDVAQDIITATVRRRR